MDFSKIKIVSGVLSLLIAAGMLSGCSGQSSAGSSSSSPQSSEDSSSAAAAADSIEAMAIQAKYDEQDLDTSSESAEEITLSGTSAHSASKNVTVDGSVVTITAAGIYRISGNLMDGQLIVDAGDKDDVHLIFGGAGITCSNSAAVFVKNADKVIVTLEEGTENKLTDGAEYVYADSAADEPDAAFYSKSDLTINGTGSLEVNGNFKNGLTGKDDLILISGNITVNAVNDGIRGRDSLTVKDASVTVTAGGDGMKSNNDEDAQKGWILLENGAVQVDAGEDGIQAETSMLVSGGTLNILSGGGSANGTSKTSGDFGGMRPGQQAQSSSDTSTDETSMKGLKAGNGIAVTGGTVTVDSADDSIHTNNSVAISGGTFSLTSGDDGIHSDTFLEISGGVITVNKSYEGIESAQMILSGGEITVTASDDGINVAGGNDGSSVNGRPGQNGFSAGGSNTLAINGGAITVNAGGDGIDVNGSLTMTGGTVIVHGPTNAGNGALDYDGTFEISGGFIVAAGSSGMAMSPSTASSQNSIMVNFDSVLEAGTLVNIQSSDGKNVLTFAPLKQFQNIVISSPDIVNGTTYSISSGGTAEGTAVNGLYSGEGYTGGTEFASVTVSESVTTVGEASGGMGGGFSGGEGGFGGGRGNGGGMGGTPPDRGGFENSENSNSSGQLPQA